MRLQSARVPLLTAATSCHSGCTTQVPVLTHKDASGAVRSVYESLICNEYLEERHPVPALLPSDPVARAHARIVIDRFNSKYVPVFYRFLIRYCPTFGCLLRRNAGLCCWPSLLLWSQAEHCI